MSHTVRSRAIYENYSIYKLKFTKTSYVNRYLFSVDIIAGGLDTDNFGNNYYDTILEYDITGDSIRNIGRMREAHQQHGVSVVQSADFSQWWMCSD